MADKKVRGRAAKNAITRNITNLSGALSTTTAVFRGTAQRCQEKGLLSSTEMDQLFDVMIAKPLASRVDEFVGIIQRLVGTLPDQLDIFLCVLHEADAILVQSAAEDIASTYGYPLPQYRTASGIMDTDSGTTPTAIVGGGIAPAGGIPTATTTGGGHTTANTAGLPPQSQPVVIKQPAAGELNNEGGQEKMEVDFFGSSSSPVHSYDVNTGKDRGVALIINNVKFEGAPDRDSSDRDAERLKTTFEKLHYTVVTQEDLTAEGMKSVLAAVATLNVKKDHDSFVCCILSHGNPQGIEGIDHEVVSVTELANTINATKCSKLRGKPKLFFLQACRGTEVTEPSVADSTSLPFPPTAGEMMVADGTFVKAIPPEADFLFGFSTCKGNVAARGIHTGSQYIKALCEVFDNHASKLNLYELLLVVNRKVALNPVEIPVGGVKHTYHQMPEIRSTLLGKFRFKK